MISKNTVLTIAVVVGILATLYYVTTLFNDDPSGPLFVSSDVDFMSYYENAQTGDEDYTVTDVYMRSENNFLQGLYFDKDIRTFYESAGLYG